MTRPPAPSRATARTNPQQLARIARGVFWVALLTVLYFALAPVTDRDPLTGWDKANHVLSFAALAVSGLVGWSGRARTVLAGLVLYGVLIELLQLATPDRHFDLHDLVADVAGIAVGCCVLQAGRLTTRFRAAAARAPERDGG